MRQFLSPSLGLAILALQLLCAGVVSVRPAAAEINQWPRQLEIDGPPAPAPPGVISRDDAGRATVRAVRLRGSLDLDGRLDESIYERVLPIGGFIQQVPREGEPATEATEVWVLFDDDHVYIAARCWDSQPERRVVGNLQRDGNLTRVDNFAVVLDTFYNHRDGYYFQTNRLGAMRDQLFTDEGNPNASWNTVWQVRTATFDGGWSVEMAIPFKSLRYRSAGQQLWGINFRRSVRWKNEVSFLTRIPAQYGDPGLYRMSMAGTLVGLETPTRALNLEAKAYALGVVGRERSPGVSTEKFTRNGGFDVAYGLTRGLVATTTYNTDFAQVEEDATQVNLTRFSLFFPEKREFFLESQGLFAFGGGSRTEDVPILFFSRRIGLEGGRTVPVIGGARLTGRAGRFDVGLLHVSTESTAPAAAGRTDFSVFRIKRAILRQSYVGIIGARRSAAEASTAPNLTAGIDANLALSPALTISSYYARTWSPDKVGDESSHRLVVDYATDRYGLRAERLEVGEDFSPEIGYLRRSDLARSALDGRVSARPSGSGSTRRVSVEGSYDEATDSHGAAIQTREMRGVFRVEMHTSDEWSVSHVDTIDVLPGPFALSSSATIEPGRYHFRDTRAEYQRGENNRMAGRVWIGVGSFYDGQRVQVGLSGGRIRVSPRFEIEPGLSWSRVSLPEAEVRPWAATTRFSVTPTTTLLLSSIIQYNAQLRSLSSSVRLRWEYASGSDLFVVISDGRNYTQSGLQTSANHSVALKVTRLVRF